MVTVNPTPHVNTNPMTQALCSGSTTSITLSSTVTGSTFAWTASSSSLLVTGYSAGSGNSIIQTLTNPGFTIETVTYSIIPTANGCSGPASTFVVTVNPIPDVSNNPMSTQICSATSPNVALTSDVAGATFTWTATGSSPNITGYGPGSGLIINQVLTNSGLTTETVTYHVTPHANGCNGTVTNYVVTVVAVPDVYFTPPAQTICNAQTTGLSIQSHVPGTTFAWTASASSLNVSGFSAGNGSMIVQTLYNSGNTIETVTYAVAPTAYGCQAGPSQNLVVTVNPKPAVTNIITSFQQCSAATTNIIPTSSVSGSSYTWTSGGSSPQVSGYSNGAGLMIQQTLVNSGFNLETVTYGITPIANSCSGDPVNFVVTVFPVPDAYFTPAGQTMCTGQTTGITILSHVTGTSFTWTATGSSGFVNGYSAGSGTLIQQTLNNTGYNVETVTYAAHPTANGCPGTLHSAIVNVDPYPSVSFAACFDEVTTTNGQPIRLKGGTPLGGAYSGAGVSAGQFYPAVAGTGTFTITYSYTNTYSCSQIASATITVLSPIPFSCGNALTDIRDNQAYPTIQIGTQCWMASNLDFGSQISSSLVQRDNCQPEKWCYSDNPSNCTSNGGLYQWDEMMLYNSSPAAQGFCPPGWHIPTETEWTTLFNSYISNGFAGSPLKTSGYSGFNALLDGVRFNYTNWNFNNFATLIWSSTPQGPNKAWAHGMNTYDPSVSSYPSSRTNGFPIRCLKD